MPNHWEPIGVIYLTYYWMDAENQIILDQRDVVANEIFRFIEEALEGRICFVRHVNVFSATACLSALQVLKAS